MGVFQGGRRRAPRRLADAAGAVVAAAAAAAAAAAGLARGDGAGSCWVSRAGLPPIAQGPCDACITYEQECGPGDPQCTEAETAGKLTAVRAECGSLERCDALRVFAENVECCTADLCNPIEGREPVSGFRRVGGLKVSGPVTRVAPLAWYQSPGFVPGGALPGACQALQAWPEGEETRVVMSGQCYYNPASEMHEKYSCTRVALDSAGGGVVALQLNYTMRYFEADCKTARNVVDVAGGGKTNGFSFDGPAETEGAQLEGCLEGQGANRAYGLTIACEPLCDVVNAPDGEPHAECIDVAPFSGAEYSRARLRRWEAESGVCEAEASAAGGAGEPELEATYELGVCHAEDGGEGGSHRYFCGQGASDQGPRPVVHRAFYSDADCGSFASAEQWFLDVIPSLNGLACGDGPSAAAAGGTYAMDCLPPTPDAAGGGPDRSSLPMIVAGAASGAVVFALALTGLLGWRRRAAEKRMLQTRMLLSRAAHSQLYAGGAGSSPAGGVRRGTESTYNPLSAATAGGRGLSGGA